MCTVCQLVWLGAPIVEGGKALCVAVGMMQYSLVVQYDPLKLLINNFFVLGYHCFDTIYQIREYDAIMVVILWLCVCLFQ